MIRLAIVAVLALSGCDLAKKKESGVAEVPAGERRSREHETCARTPDCDGELRCVGGVCRDAFDSPVGELEAARGDRALIAGQPAAAVERYAAAMARYESDKIAAPARLLCAYGRAAAAVGDPKQAELGARLLHRCSLATPPGAPLHDVAASELAALVDRGLDPEAVARGVPVDVYLVNANANASAFASADAAAAAAAPPAAPTEAQVALTGDGKTRARSYQALLTKLAADPAAKAALALCLASHTATTQERRAEVELRFRHGYRLDENDDFERATIEVDEPPADAALARCVRDALLPRAAEIVRKLAEESRWAAPIRVEIAG